MLGLAAAQCREMLKRIPIRRKLSRCEVVEMRNSADADGYLCSKTASTQCSDCGSELCESHVETCGGCHAIFCPGCFFFHRALRSLRTGNVGREKGPSPSTAAETEHQRLHQRKRPMAMMPSRWLSLPNMFTASAVHGIGWPLLG